MSTSIRELLRVEKPPWDEINIQQVTDDQGTLADRLNGFVGHSFGIGPIITSTKPGESQLDFNARWIHDFDVRRAVEGDGLSFVASLKF